MNLSEQVNALLKAHRMLVNPDELEKAKALMLPMTEMLPRLAIEGAIVADDSVPLGQVRLLDRDECEL